MNFFKKTTVLLCSILLLTFGVTFASAEQKSPESLTIIGDSIASGYGLEGYNAGDKYTVSNYGKLLKDRYGISDDCYFNYAVDGETTDGLISKLESGAYDEGISSSDVIVISIGGNDLLDVIIGENSAVFQDTDLEAFLNGEVNIAQLLKGTDLKELAAQMTADAQEQLVIFYQNMPKIAKIIAEKNPDALVVLQTLYNPMNSGVEIIDNLYGQAISSLNLGIEGMEGCVVADVNKAFAESDKDLIQSDFTHPNAEGHKLIFETVRDVIDESFASEVVEKPDEPVSTQPVETTTTVTTTTATQSTTTAPVTTTISTSKGTVSSSNSDSSKGEENKDFSGIVVPTVCIAIGLVVICAIVVINKKRKN